MTRTHIEIPFIFVCLFSVIDGVCDYLDVNPPKNPPRIYKSSSGGVRIISNEYWKTAYYNLMEENPKIRIQIKTKLKELKELKEKRVEKLAEFVKLNLKFKETMKDNLSVSDPFVAIDRAFNEVYRRTFDISVCEDLKNDLKVRREKIIRLKNYSKAHSFKTEQLPNKMIIADKNQFGKYAGKIIAKSWTECFKAQLPVFQQWSETQSLLSWPRELQECSRSPILADGSENEEFERIGAADNDLLKEYQSIERELFILKQRDVNYAERIQECDEQIKIYDEFITDLRHDLNGGNRTITRATKWKHLHKQSERIDRLTQVYNAKAAQLNLFEAWHRRNLLEIYTKPKFIYYHKTGELYQTISGEIYAKLNAIWDVKPVIDEMFVILSNKSGENGFSLDLALKAYFKLEERQNLVPGHIKDPAKNIKKFLDQGFDDKFIYPDSMIFTVAALYHELAGGAGEANLTIIRQNWPRVSDTFLKEK